jgi:hypothetical protein
MPRTLSLQLGAAGVATAIDSASVTIVVTMTWGVAELTITDVVAKMLRAWR